MCPGGDGMRQSFHFSDHLSFFLHLVMFLLNPSFSRYNSIFFRDRLCGFRPTNYSLVINVKVLYSRINIYNRVCMHQENVNKTASVS
jgi:hypothetical protein